MSILQRFTYKKNALYTVQCTVYICMYEYNVHVIYGFFMYPYYNVQIVKKT